MFCTAITKCVNRSVQRPTNFLFLARRQTMSTTGKGNVQTDVHGLLNEIVTNNGQSERARHHKQNNETTRSIARSCSATCAMQTVQSVRVSPGVGSRSGMSGRSVRPRMGGVVAEVGGRWRGERSQQSTIQLLRVKKNAHNRRNRRSACR